MLQAFGEQELWTCGARTGGGKLFSLIRAQMTFIKRPLSIYILAVTAFGGKTCILNCQCLFCFPSRCQVSHPEFIRLSEPLSEELTALENCLTAVHSLPQMKHT